MIIAFSGLGGSGKTTQIALLEKNLRNEGVSTTRVVLRDLLWWPKIVSWFKPVTHGNSSQSSWDVHQKPSWARRIYLIIRAVFYSIDMWRVVIAYRSRSQVIIFDRFAQDFFVELLMGDEKMPGWMRILIAIAPRADIHYYFDISPEDSVERKYEHPLETVVRQYDWYHWFQYGMIRVSAISDRQVLANVIAIYTVSCHRNGICPPAQQAYIEMAAGCDWQSFFECFRLTPNDIYPYAAINRMIAHVVCTISDSRFATDQIKKLEKVCVDAREQMKKTKEFFQSLVDDAAYSLVKNDESQIEKSGDFDVIIFDRHDYDMVLDRLAGQGIVRLQTNNKADVFIDGLLPIDLHHGASFGHFEYIDRYAFQTASPEAVKILAVIGHAVAEYTMVLHGDMIKLSSVQYDRGAWREARMHAKRIGWVAGFDAWKKIYETTMTSGRYPGIISSVSLFMMRVHLCLKQGSVVSLGKDLVMTARAIRARSQRKVPFHEPWVNEL